jgi:signal transduction histidine kinase
MTKATSETSKARILIIEDDPATVELMEAQLHGEGYSVDSVRDGDQAAAKLSETPPDLVLLDIMLPKKSGFEVCKQIKENEATSSIPVVMVTALKDMESRVKGIAVGADDFLSRPVDKSELLARVRSILRISNLNKELAIEMHTARESGEKLEVQQRVLKSMSAQLMQASHLKYEFIVNMSHALRTPLNVIIGFSEMLQDGLVGELNEKQGKYVENIRESGRELHQLIAHVVDIFKIDTGKVPLETTEFQLRDAIDSLLAAYEPIATDNRITVTVNVAPDVLRICADPQRLSTILDSLLSNAFKFTPSGGRVDVTAEVQEDQVRICVADSGCGLSPEDCERVFLEFYRVPDSGAAAGAGSGLGLAISRKLVMLHGGNIWAESEGEDTGARFIFTLPLRRE